MELVVVIAILGLLLVFSVPLFRKIGIMQGESGVSDLVGLIDSLKEKAVARDKDFYLNIDTRAGLVWITDAAMNEEEQVRAKLDAKTYGGKTRLLNLERPEPDNERVHRILFSRKGYSDRALIHLRQDDRDMTLRIGMFLRQVSRFDGYLSYDDCI